MGFRAYQKLNAWDAQSNATGIKQMNDLPKIKDIMATELVLLRPELEIIHAMKILLENRVSGAPVVDAEGLIVGVLSKKDCLRAALNASYHQEWGDPVSRYMSKNIETLDPELDLVEATVKFLASDFRRFPVVKDNRLIGQISRADLLKALIDNWS